MSAQAPSLFIGMVTHARSRFNADGAANRMMESLALAAEALGIDVVSVVGDRDDYDPVQFPMSRMNLIRWAVHQARLEYRWRRYLAAGGADDLAVHGRDLLIWGAMTAKRAVESVSPHPWDAVEDLTGAKAAVRLLNIDLSHLRLMDEAAKSGCDWVLILEDDAGFSDPDVAMREVAGVMAAIADTGAGFVSLSESLGLNELGVGGILAPAPDLESGIASKRSLWRASRPVTNTVCANLYRRGFLAMVREEIGRQGLVPVAPIDWRLNAALMALFEGGRVDSQTCLWLRPGAFVQRSMHGSVNGS